MGENLPFMPAELKTESTRVHGCQSTVHLFGVGRDGKLDFLATSDAALVRGLDRDFAARLLGPAGRGSGQVRHRVVPPADRPGVAPKHGATQRPRWNDPTDPRTRRTDSPITFSPGRTRPGADRR